MFCHKKDIYLIDKVHKRTLRTVYNDFTLSFEELLLLDNYVTFHTRHIHILMQEVYKSCNSEGPSLVGELFSQKVTTFNLRGKTLLELPKTNSITYGTNSILFKACFLWNTLPNEYKDASSLAIFKNRIRNWNGNTCTCFICT